MLDPVSRRRFLKQLAVISGAVLLSPARTPADAPVAWVPVGPAGKFKKGSFTRVTLPEAYHGQEVYVTQEPEGTYLALLSRCTHQGCAVDWEGDRKEFVCPCHSGRYDARGKNIGGPPPQPLRALRTRVDTQGTLSVQAP